MEDSLITSGAQAVLRQNHYTINFSVSERTVRRRIALFQIIGDVMPCKHRHGPTLLLGELILNK